MILTLKIWGSSAPSGQVVPISDENYKSGFYYLGNNPPTAEEFNWLFQQVTQGIIDAGGFWQASKAYAVGNILSSSLLANSNKYFECTTAGTSGTTEPTWGAVGTTVTDGAAVWTIRDVRDARKLQTARKINNVLFDGSADINLTPENIGAAPDGYGLGGSGVDISSTDANLLTNCGFYAGNSVENAGTSNGVALINSRYKGNAGYGLQLIGNVETQSLGYRIETANVWSALKKLATTDQIPTTAAQVGAAPDGYGLGGDAIAVTDFHSIHKSGFYRGYNALNSPPALSDTWITVVASAILGTEAMTLTAQSYAPGDVGKLWVCSQYGGTWSAWEQLATTDKTTYIVASGSGTSYYWRKWSNGDIEQWVQGAPITTEVYATVAFPVAFTTNVRPPQVTTQVAVSTSNDNMAQLVDYSLTTVGVFRQQMASGNSAAVIPVIYAIGK